MKINFMKEYIIYEKRIIEGTVLHKDIELPTYVPQIKKNEEWVNIQDDGCYILKEGYNPLITCKKCNGKGLILKNKCNECSGNGLRKTDPTDLKYIAEILLENS